MSVDFHRATFFLVAGIWSAWFGLDGRMTAIERCGADSRDSMEARVASYYLMGTRILIEAEGAKGMAEKAVEDAYLELERVDRLMSTFKADSEVSRFNRESAGQGFEISPMTSQVIGEALRLADVSGGAFDPTVGPLVRLWGFSRPSLGVPPPERLSATLARVGYRYLTWDRSARALRADRTGVELDLGAIAKGFAVDRAVAAMRRVGVERGAVDLGESSIGFFGGTRRIGIRHPLGRREVVAHLELTRGAVSTSAGYERGFERDGRWYSHIIDPRTGWPVPSSMSATVVAEEGEAMKADALSTAGFVLGPSGAVQLWRREGVQGILFFHNGESIDFVKTPGFPVEVRGNDSIQPHR